MSIPETGQRAQWERLNASRAASQLREMAMDAVAPCRHCDRTEPHAFENPDAHTWDPHHLVVDPAAIISALGAEGEAS
jgi:hypothetical protein